MTGLMNPQQFPMAQMGQMGQMSGGMGQMGQMGGMGQMNQMNQMSQMNQMNQMNQMKQMNQMGGMAGMGAMGGAMGNMAGVGGMAGMGGMNGVGRGMPNPNMQQINTNNASQLNRYILQSLQQEGAVTSGGWQAEVTMQDRLAQVRRLVDSLKLLGPGLEMSRAVDVAINFERKEFTNQPTKEDYRRECQQKLSQIRDQRQNQVRQGMGMAPGMQMMNPAFQQQMQMNRNIGMQPQFQQGMQQNQIPNTPLSQQAMMSQGQGLNPQMSNMTPNLQRRVGDPSTGLTPDDNKMINQRAAEMAQGYSAEDINRLKETMDPRLRANLEAKGVDPVLSWFRMSAAREFKARQMQAGGTPANGQMNQLNNNLAGVNQMSGGPPNPGNMAMAGQPGNNLFTGNPSQFQEQREAGMRSQEEGQMVVPASNQNMLPDQFRMQQQLMGNPQRLAQQNAAMNPQLLTQQRLKMQQMQQQQRQMQNQQQGQNQPQNQTHPEQSPAQSTIQNTNQTQGGMQANSMGMLNRPVGAGMAGASPQPQRPPARGAMPGQQPQAGNLVGQPGINQPQINNGEDILAKVPPALRGVLQSRPRSEWHQSISNYMRRTASQQPPGSQAGLSGQQPGQQMSPGQFPGPSPMQQSRSAGQNAPQMPNNNQQQNAQAAQQELARQRHLAQMQQQAKMAGGPSGQNNADISVQSLTSHQMQTMDALAVPQAFLTSIREKMQAQNMFMPDLKTWSHLKQWLQQNQSFKFPLQSIIQVQTQHFNYLRRQQQQQQKQQKQQQPPQQQSQPQPPPPQPPQGAQGPVKQNQSQQQAQQRPPLNQRPGQPVNQATQAQNMPQQPGPNFLGNQAQAAPPVRPITDQDIQRIRQQNPNARNMSDDQIRQFFLMRQQQQNAARLAQLQQASQQAQQQRQQLQTGPQQQQQRPGQQNFTPQSGVQASPMQAQLSQGQPTQQSQLQIPNAARPQSTKATPQMQRQPSQTPHESKGIKRPNDDGTELPQTRVRDFTSDPMKSLSNMTREEFSKLDPQKQQQLVQMKQKRDIVERISGFAKEAQATMPPVRPITNMDLNSRKRINDLLTSQATKNMLSRFDPFLISYYALEKDESSVKQLISQRNHLVAQYKPNTVADKTFQPNDHFSVTPENIERIIETIMSKFKQTSEKYQQQQPRPRQMAPGQMGQQVSQTQRGNPGLQPSNQGQQPLPLTPENLRLAQEQQAAQQQKKGQKPKEAPPAAPTASQPPFQLGIDKGRGTPIYPQSGGLKQEDLKRDSMDSKRRKKNPTVTTPATPATATASPEIIKEHKPIAKHFKCTTPGCEWQKKSFNTQAQLDQHVKEVHQKPEMESIVDPLAFLDTSMQQGLNLDARNQPIVKLDTTAFNGPPMQKSVSKAGSNLKIESKPSTPTQMARVPSQQAGKPPSTPNILRTPQSMKESVKGGSQKPNELPIETDLWANSHITIDNLRDSIGDADWNEVMPTLDVEQLDLDNVLGTYMQSDEWQQIMNNETILNSSDESTDKSTNKSKSSEHGSEPSNTVVPTSQQPTAAAGPNDAIDSIFDNISIDPGFEDMIINDIHMPADDTSPWEFAEKPTPPLGGRMAPDPLNPFTSDDDELFASWENEPLTMEGLDELGTDGFPDPTNMSPFEPIDFPELYDKNGPEVWAAGTLEWNAVGKSGEEARKALGWPAKGAQGVTA